MFLFYHHPSYPSFPPAPLQHLHRLLLPPLPPLCLSFSLSTLRSLIAHEDSVTCVRFQPETHYFFSSGKDGVLKYWDADRFVLGGTVLHVTLCRYLLLTAHHAVKTKDDDRYPAFSRLSPPLSFSFFPFPCFLPILTVVRSPYLGEMHNELYYYGTVNIKIIIRGIILVPTRGKMLLSNIILIGTFRISPHFRYLFHSHICSVSLSL